MGEKTRTPLHTILHYDTNFNSCIRFQVFGPSAGQFRFPSETNGNLMKIDEIQMEISRNPMEITRNPIEINRNPMEIYEIQQKSDGNQ